MIPNEIQSFLSHIIHTNNADTPKTISAIKTLV